MELTKKAQEVLDKVNKGENANDILDEYTEDTDWSCSDGFGYGLFSGGYIRPALIVSGEDLIELQTAIKIVGDFKEIWEKISIEF